MLRAHQTLSQKELNLRDKTQVEFYISVIQRYSRELLKLTKIIVADAFFSTKTFTDGIKKFGFNLVSRLRDNSCLFYLYDGEQKKRGRKRVKGDFKTSGYRPNRTLISKIFKDLFSLQRKAA